MRKDRLICCDWGTSNLRIYLVDMMTSKVLQEVRSDQGVSHVYEEYNRQVSLSQRDYFLQFLSLQIKQLSNGHKESFDRIPVIASGMASSSIGIIDIDYAKLPFSLVNPQLKVKKIETSAYCPHEVYVFGGLKSNDDVMRGEEVELLGLSGLINDQDCLCILPGTHSKHVTLESGRIKRFRTFMTGEIFGLLVNHSILKQSVTLGRKMKQGDKDAFIEGVNKGSTMNLLSSLFKIRTRDIIENTSARLNFFYLSGLLIGHELGSLPEGSQKIVLCGGDQLALYYELALDLLVNKDSFDIISSRQMKEAVPLAHIYLFNNLNCNKN